jgi:hypothetical protein
MSAFYEPLDLFVANDILRLFYFHPTDRSSFHFLFHRLLINSKKARHPTIDEQMAKRQSDRCGSNKMATVSNAWFWQLLEMYQPMTVAAFVDQATLRLTNCKWNVCSVRTSAITACGWLQSRMPTFESLPWRPTSQVGLMTPFQRREAT